jgi:hypothetical protein
MAPRYCLPGEFYVDAVVLNQLALLDQWRRAVDTTGAGRVVAPPADLVGRVSQSRSFVALRWVLNPTLGIPVAPFTVWTRPATQREAASQVVGWHQSADASFTWDGLTEMLHLEIDVSSGPATALGYAANGNLVATASSAGAGAATLVLEGGPMLSVRVFGPGGVTAARGLSTTAMAAGSGWARAEIVGLPVSPDSVSGLYYHTSKQGPMSALTDPVTAAVNRLVQWGPKLGWMTLSGLGPWTPPDPKLLIDDLESDLLPALRKVLASQPPPDVDRQVLQEVVVQVNTLQRKWGAKVALNDGTPSRKSEVHIRPLQSLCSAVASDVWSSLALGFGTGLPLSSDPAVGNVATTDFMVTAPWSGTLRVTEEIDIPSLRGLPPVEVAVPVERELVGIVLAPRPRPWPAAPSSLAAAAAFLEGTDGLDAPYRVATAVTAARPPVLPERPRVAAFALARYDTPAKGSYEMRPHPKAGGFIPLAAAQPVAEPGQVPDPAVPADKVVLRDSGVLLPIAAPALQYQYAVAATDLFGQWGPWAFAPFLAPPADVQAPSVVSVHVTPRPGPGNADPCALDLVVDVQWDWRQRSCAQIELAVQVSDPPAPPASIPPPAAPAALPANATIHFDASGLASTGDANVTVRAASDDGGSLFPGAHPPGTPVRRFRVWIAGFAVVYAGALEKAVAVFARGQETKRPGEWSQPWSGPKEAAIAPNPIPPQTPVPLPKVYPFWASLPDPAGESRATVAWAPSGGAKYRVYEATEASLLAALGHPGPDLNDTLSNRMQALFDLYKAAAAGNSLGRLKAVYRKVTPDPIQPPVQVDGQMRYDVALPCGSSLIHCFVVVALTPANEISSWPPPDGDGRKAFLPFVIPHVVRPAMPEITARLDATGVPQIQVSTGGAVPVTGVRLYRASNARLARAVGTMDLVTTAPPAANSGTTTVADPGATPSWQYVQYRAVLLAADDPEHAGFAVPSLPSKAYALLVPPPPLPAPTVTANVVGTTATVSIVRVNTTAPRRTGDVGDHRLSTLVTASGVAGATPDRFSSALTDLPDFPNEAALAAGTAHAAYVPKGAGEVLYLRLPRNTNQALHLALDLADPLGRTGHLSVDIPFGLPEPTPAIAGLVLTRSAGVVAGKFLANAPASPDPAHPWVLDIGLAQVFPPLSQVRSFKLGDIPKIASLAAMPTPAANPAVKFMIAQVTGSTPRQFVFWVRSTTALKVTLKLINGLGVSTTVQQTSP